MPSDMVAMSEPLLARAGVDRAAHVRSDEEDLLRLWADPRARVLRVDAGTTALSTGSAVLVWTSPEALDGPAAADLHARYFLGLDAAGVPYFAVDAPFSTAAGESVVNLRGIGPWLPAHESGLFVHAVALAAWHRRHGFCPQCGGPTTYAAAGHARTCTACGMSQFPRIDPAVIMLVVDDRDRALLAHNTAWPAGRFSTLAGFVEAGESAEHAVEREVAEEVGLVLDRVDYEGSQPWPFPSSLMLAFRAHTRDPALRADEEEITDARWFTRDELLAAVNRRDVRLPSSVSIARWLLERWYGGPLPTEHDW